MVRCVRCREHEIARQSGRGKPQRAARRAARSHAARDDNSACGNLRGAVGRLADALSAQCVQSNAIVHFEAYFAPHRADCSLRRPSHSTMELLCLLRPVRYMYNYYG